VPGAGFDAVVDTEGFATLPDDETVNLGPSKGDIRVEVDQLPTSFNAYVRAADDENAPPDPGDLSADPLLTECDRTNVLGRSAGQLDITPMSVFYKASTPTKVTGKVRTTAPNPKDRNIFGVPFPTTTVFDATIQNVPAELRADVISPISPDEDDPSVQSRKLELEYSAKDAGGNPAPISRIFLDRLESRRATSICGDPRPNRKATCLDAVLKDLPSRIKATFDPDDSKGDIDFDTAPPVGAQPKLSIDPLNLSTVSPKPKSQPLVLSANILGITPHVVGKMVSQHTAQDPAGEKSLTQMTFNACPDAPCTGIDEIRFNATNQLVGDPFGDPPPPDADTTQDFSFVQRGLGFEAQGVIRKLKEIGLQRRKGDGTPSPPPAPRRPGLPPRPPLTPRPPTSTACWPSPIRR
jgi:hypothetical protein